MDWEAFEFLIKHVQDLEELAEETEIKWLVENRPVDAPAAWTDKADFDKVWDVGAPGS